MKKAVMMVLAMVVLAFLPGASMASENTAGLGFGINYGGAIGFNYEYALTEEIGALAGIGFLPDNIGWAVGARYYFTTSNPDFRLRVSLIYGVVAAFETSSGKDDYDLGLAAGFGFNWRFNELWAIDADIFLTDDNVPEGLSEVGPSAKISFGVSRRW